MIWEYIKRLFHKDNTPEYAIKIDYLNKLNIDIYTELSSLDISVLEHSVKDSIVLLSKVNRMDMSKDEIYIKPITKSNYTTKRFVEWYSDDGFPIDKSYFNSWLREAKEFIYKYDQYKTDPGGKSYSVIRKITPYYTEVNDIIDRLYEMLN